jgi:methyl-accepting chemotaxis protein
MSRKLRFPMFFKFLVGCLALAALLIIGGTYVVKNETRFRSRGNYLQKQSRRLAGYMDRAGRGMTGTVEILASDDEIQKIDSDPAAAAAHCKEAYEGMLAKNGVQPDVFVVFTTANKVVFAPEGTLINENDLPELAAAEKVRTGTVFAHRIQMLNGVPYQMSAAPIRDPKNNQVIGGMIAAVKLQRYFEEFAEQSDDQVDLQMRPTLFDGGRVVVSAWPQARWAELAQAFDPTRIVRVAIGDDVRDVVRMPEGDFDFWTEDLEGYRNADPAVVGKLAITRSRFNLIDPAETLPWKEIVGGIVASLVIAMLMGFWITRPIKRFVKQSQDLLAGDTNLTQRLRISSNDETADLANNINQVFSRLHDLATGVQSAAFQVGASSAEISAASREMLSGLKDQTLKIEGSSAAVTELSASIQHVATNAGKATEVAEGSSKDVTSAVQRIEQIRAAVEDAAAKMRDLGESSKRIGNIVEVIRQISEQTSMLALNASIEAAHAGEQGRGFAVVADEVSSLARRVGQSAKDIEALIQTVKEQTQAAITSMDVGTREVGNGSALVTSTLNGLGELIQVVRETAGAVKEQAIVSDEIARNMDAVRHIAGEMLSGSEESVVQAERLHTLAFELEESIGGFNLDGTKLRSRGTNGESQPARRALKPAKAAAISRAEIAPPRETDD